MQTKRDKLLNVRQSIGYKSALRFSQHIDLPYGTYISIENGSYNPSNELKQKIATGLGKTMEEIFPDNVVSEVAECRLVKKLTKKELEIFLTKQFGSKLQSKVNQ